MSEKENDQHYSDEETERRATDALRRALKTPYHPQKEMIGKTHRSSPSEKPAKNSRKKP